MRTTEEIARDELLALHGIQGIHGNACVDMRDTVNAITRLTAERDEARGKERTNAYHLKDMEQRYNKFLRAYEQERDRATAAEKERDRAARDAEHRRLLLIAAEKERDDALAASHIHADEHRTARARIASLEAVLREIHERKARYVALDQAGNTEAAKIGEAIMHRGINQIPSLLTPTAPAREMPMPGSTHFKGHNHWSICGLNDGSGTTNVEQVTCPACRQQLHLTPGDLVGRGKEEAPRGKVVQPPAVGWTPDVCAWCGNLHEHCCCVRDGIGTKPPKGGANA